MDAKQIIEQNRRAYNAIAEDFLLKRQNRVNWLRFLLEYLNKGDKILDVGCGWGRLYQLFKDLPISYKGVDHSEELIKIARKKFPSARFVIAEMTDMPFKKGEFDAIYCISAFHNLLDADSQSRALKEMKRILKKKGKIIMTNWNLLGGWMKENKKPGQYIDIGDNNFIVPWKNSAGKLLGERFYHAFSAEELKKLFDGAGFKIEEQYYERKGMRTDKSNGGNIVTIATSQ